MLCNEMTSLSLAPTQPQQQPQSHQQQQQRQQQSYPLQQQQHIVSGPVLPRTSTEAMYSTAGTDGACVSDSAPDEGMDDEVCFLMDHVEVSRCDPAAPNPQGPILPYIL